jgi:UPF0755 protein
MIKNSEKTKKYKIMMFLIITSFIFIPLFSSCTPLNYTQETEAAVEKGIDVNVTIEEGMNLTQIAELLENAGVIEDAFVFRLYVQQKGKEKNLLPGDYVLITGADYEEILETITTGEKPVVYRFTIPEGFIIKQVKERILEKVPFIEQSELESALNIDNYRQYEFLKDKETLEGFLFPKTYDVSVEYSANNIIEMMLAQFQLETRSLDWSFADENDLSEYDVLIIASLIEREAYIPEERELISSVIYNRLKMDMPLQIDATVRYALEKWEDIVTYEDLEVESPYNTYKYAGITPTPICNPGLSAIEAALNPADTDYLYYLVIDENTHEHKFSNTFEEHENARNETNTTGSY